jgi:hypothetical protein
VSASDSTHVMLARRPSAPAVPAFGHLDLSPEARKRLHEIMQSLVKSATGKEKVPFHPDDLAEDDEVLTAPLNGFDEWFQEQAPWSLERTIAEMRATGHPQTLTSKAISDGGWSFYAVRSKIGRSDTVAVRAKSPSYGLNPQSKVLTKLVGGELKLVKETLIAFDRSADLLVFGQEVFVLQPRQVENLLIDAEAVKQRASVTVASFGETLKAPLTGPTLDALEHVCSHNANVARRVERLIRDGDLEKVTAAKVRAALPDARLPPNTFGTSGALRAIGDQHAIALIDIAADLYYQPRFSAAPRRVAAYRRVR